MTSAVSTRRRSASYWPRATKSITTMSGRGRVWRIDLSDGNEILRVLLEREGNYGGSYGNIVRLRVDAATRPPHTHHLNERLDTHSLKSVGQISGNYYTRVKEKFGDAVELEAGASGLPVAGRGHKSAALR